VARIKVVRFGAIGPGGAGRSRTKQLNADPAVQVVAAADTNADNIKALEEVLGHEVEVFRGPKGYRRMIDRVPLDAVGIFSPHSLHYEQAMYALNAGKHVLIEKPMVCGAGPAIETARLAAANDLVYLIHYQRHYEPMYIKARELIRKGAIGEVQSFYVYMVQDWSGKAWRGDPKYSGGGQINDSGSHYQDILLWMTGLLPKSVEGHIDYYYRGQKKRVQMNGSFMVELSNGAAGRLIIVSDYVGRFSDDVRIVGDKGYLRFASGSVLVHGKDKKGPPREIKATLPRGYPVSPADNFARLLTGRTRKNRVDPIFGARVALLTDALLLAGETGKRVYCERLLRRAGCRMDMLRNEGGAA